jgi:hypothetical protein
MYLYFLDTPRTFRHTRIVDRPRDRWTNTHEDGRSLEWLIPCCCCWRWWTSGIQSYCLCIFHIYIADIPKSATATQNYAQWKAHCSNFCTTCSKAPFRLDLGVVKGWAIWQPDVKFANTDATKPSCAVYDLPKVSARLVYFQLMQFPVVRKQATPRQATPRHATPTHIAIVTIKLAREKQSMWMCGN